MALPARGDDLQALWWLHELGRTDIVSQTITVCDACLTAACWQGEFMCQEGRRCQVRSRRAVEELQALKLEHPDWWDIDPDTGCSRAQIAKLGL